MKVLVSDYLKKKKTSVIGFIEPTEKAKEL